MLLLAKTAFMRVRRESGSATKIEFGGAAADATTRSDNFSFASVPIGNAAANRYVVLVIAKETTNSFTNVTVAGNSTSQVADNDRVQIYITSAPVTTGTTATIVLENSLPVPGAGIAAYALYGTPSTESTDTASGTSALTFDPAGAASCVFIAGVLSLDNPHRTHTWTGTSSPSEANDTTIVTDTSSFTSAYGNAGTGTLNIVCTPIATTDNSYGVCAVWTV